MADYVLEAVVRINALYVLAIGVALGAALMIVWLMGAVGILGIEGDPADRMYFGVLAVGVVGALVARFRPTEMAYAMMAMVLALGGVAAAALAMGMHTAPYSSILEIVGINGIFGVLFTTSAFLFWRSGRSQAVQG
ncbi:MAG TPA: hypothetical protein VGO52_25265 [Hyphomonadaceae bacterium]|jgi:hypothetical protein|nr:hypothetical protein [Hyphomonadaceae bacterium]